MPGFLIETPAGLLDEAGPEERIKTETEEETGYRVGEVRKVFELYMSPGSVTEKLYFFVGAYDPALEGARRRRRRGRRRGHRGARASLRGRAAHDGDGRDRGRQDATAAAVRASPPVPRF